MFHFLFVTVRTDDTPTGHEQIANDMFQPAGLYNMNDLARKNET